MDDYASKPILGEQILGPIEKLTRKKTAMPLMDSAATIRGEFSGPDRTDTRGAIGTAAATGDALTMERKAHSLKGSGQDLSAHALDVLCAELEALAATGCYRAPRNSSLLLGTAFVCVQDEISRRF